MKILKESFTESSKWSAWWNGNGYTVSKDGVVDSQYDVDEKEEAEARADELNKNLTEDTVKTKDGKWVNKGKEGTHGEFDTKKQADAQRRAMFAQGYKG